MTQSMDDLHCNNFSGCRKLLSLEVSSFGDDGEDSKERESDRVASRLAVIVETRYQRFHRLPLHRKLWVGSQSLDEVSRLIRFCRFFRFD